MAMPNTDTARRLRRAAASALLVMGCGAVSAQQQGPVCGPLWSHGQYGPYDYRRDADRLTIVLDNHFTPEVESLARGKTSLKPGGDLDYTLRAIPNHHRALLAMMRLGEKEKSNQVPEATYPVECYFERAIRFRSDDQVVHMLYASYLIRNRRPKDALVQLDIAAGQADDSPFTHYNVGLLYLDVKEYEKALAQAHAAYALGFTQPLLKEKLAASGHWREPPPSGPVSTTANDSASSSTAAASGVAP